MVVLSPLPSSDDLLVLVIRLTILEHRVGYSSCNDM